MRAMKPHIILDQIDDELIGHEFAMLRLFRDLNPEKRAQFHFTPQDGARRRDRNAEMSRDHLGLGPLS